MSNQIAYWVPLLSAVVGGVLVGIINFAMRWQDRKSEERRHLRELMFRSAVEEWKQHSMFAIEVMKMTTGKKIAMEPLVTYIVHLLKLSEVLIDGKITKENLSQKFTEVNEVMMEVKKFTMPPKKENE
jgi:hypothetical protein